MRSSILVDLIGLLGVSLVGCVDLQDDPAESQLRSNIVGGTSDVVTDGVVAVGFGIEPHCSGAVISPHVVLTAAHCLPRAVDGLVVLAGWDLGAPTVSVPAHVVVTHPSYDGHDNDLGLIALQDPLPVPPLALAATSPVAGDSVTVVGFGRDETGRAGAKRAGKATIAAVDAHTLDLAGAPALTCDGDSGGPTLDASGQIVGIHALSNCLDIAVETRPDGYFDFVEPFIAQAETHQVCIGGVCDGPITGGCSAGGSAGAGSLVMVAVAALLEKFSKRRQPSRKELSCPASPS